MAQTSREADGVNSLNIDILRTFLAQWVIIDHVASVLLPIPLVPGRLAVWGFFVVSGYLNTLSFLRCPGTLPPRRAALLYYNKRVRRIYPLLLASYGVVSICVGTPWNADAFTLFPAVIWNRMEYSNGPLWTLVVELQLYLLTPLLVRTVQNIRERVSLRTLLLGAALLVYAVPALHILLTGERGMVDERSSIGNIGFYLFGMLLALSAPCDRLRDFPLAPLLLALVFFLVVFNVGLLAVLWLLGPLLAFSFSYYFLSHSAPVLPIGHAVFRFLGHYTYEIYVLHGLFTFISRVAGVHDQPAWVLLFSWVLPLATILVMSRLPPLPTTIRVP